MILFTGAPNLVGHIWAKCPTATKDVIKYGDSKSKFFFRCCKKYIQSQGVLLTLFHLPKTCGNHAGLKIIWINFKGENIP